MAEEYWLDSLKVGDEVCYRSRYHGYVIEVIEKITPKRQIKTKHHTYKNGYCGSGWDGHHIEPVTQKVRDNIRANDLYKEINSFKFDKLNLEQLEKVHDLISGFSNPSID